MEGGNLFQGTGRLQGLSSGHWQNDPLLVMHSGKQARPHRPWHCPRGPQIFNLKNPDGQPTLHGARTGRTRIPGLPRFAGGSGAMHTGQAEETRPCPAHRQRVSHCRELWLLLGSFSNHWLPRQRVRGAETGREGEGVRMGRGERQRTRH